MLRIGLVTSLVVLALACAAPARTQFTWNGATPDPEVINLLPVRFANDSGATEAVLTECNLSHGLPEWIAQYTPVPVVLALTPDHGMRVLDLTFTTVMAPAGGSWTGAKQLTVHGDLIENGTVIASVDVQRTTWAGGWSAGGGTCEVLDYLSESIAKDIRPWLANPTHAALLGELR